MLKKPLLSVIVLTFNEEKNISACLESLQNIPHTLYVVDSGSTDKTLEIAQKYHATVLHHPFENYGKQRNWAIKNIPIESPWILHIDADERLSKTLAENISKAIENPPTHIVGYYFSRKTVFMGRWIKYGGHYPVYHLRLLKNGYGSCEDRLYDQHFMASGTCIQLKGDLIDVVASDIQTWTERHLKWSLHEAKQYFNTSTENHLKGELFSKNTLKQRRWLRQNMYDNAPLFWRVGAYTFYRYILRLGFLDGKEGAIFHFLQGTWFRWMVDVHIDQLKKASEP